MQADSYKEGLGFADSLRTLQWRHNGHDSVWNHQPHDCLLNRLFRRRSKKTSKLRVTCLCAGNSPGISEFSAQMASYAENVSIWWRHPEVCTRLTQCYVLLCLGGRQVDRLHKSHNAPVPYPIMLHLVTEMCIPVHISVTKWCVVGYLYDALWDLWDGSMWHQYQQVLLSWQCDHDCTSVMESIVKIMDKIIKLIYC